MDCMIPEYGGNGANLAGIARQVRVLVGGPCATSRNCPRLVQDQDFLSTSPGQTSHMDSMVDPATDTTAASCRRRGSSAVVLPRAVANTRDPDRAGAANRQADLASDRADICGGSMSRSVAGSTISPYGSSARRVEQEILSCTSRGNFGSSRTSANSTRATCRGNPARFAPVPPILGDPCQSMIVTRAPRSTRACARLEPMKPRASRHQDTLARKRRRKSAGAGQWAGSKHRRPVRANLKNRRPASSWPHTLAACRTYDQKTLMKTKTSPRRS